MTSQRLQQHQQHGKKLVEIGLQAKDVGESDVQDEQEPVRDHQNGGKQRIDRNSCLYHPHRFRNYRADKEDRDDQLHIDGLPEWW